MWAYFSNRELTCKCGCGQQEMNPDYMVKLVKLRHELDFPMPLTSAYRCKRHNKLVGGSIRSAHLEGRATDTGIAGERAFYLVRAAFDHGFTGIGVQQRGGKNFVHIDDSDDPRTRPRIWTY